MLSFNKFNYKYDQFKNNIMNNSLGIPRKEMPQVASAFVPEFLEWLKKEHGVRSRKKMLKAKDLKITQNELDFNKVMRLIDKGQLKGKPIMVSSDGYILDGSHRWAATVLSDGAERIEARVIDTPIRDLLDYARNFSKTSYKNLAESQEGVDTLADT